VPQYGSDDRRANHMENGSGMVDVPVPEKPSKPPKSRCLVRQKIAAQQQAQAAPQESQPVTAVDARQHVLQALACLGATASKLSLVIVQPELDSEELRALGFAAVRTGVESADPFHADSPHTSGILIVNFGAEFQTALQFLSSLDQASNPPPIMAVLVFPGEAYLDIGEQELHCIQKTFLETGADDVMSLFGKETITSHRVHEAILRTEIMARKASAMITQEVERMKTKTSRTLQVAWKRFMWDLPGKVLESIPSIDNTLQERTEQDVGIGEYAFTCQLGAGTFGAVFKADHPKHGVCAVKVIAKTSVKNVCQLFSVDSELCIMSNLAEHPNVVHARGALHTESNIILIMDYAGDMNLHMFVVKTLKSSGDSALSAELVEGFCKQEAAAVAHLHSSMVCHRDLKPTNFIVTNDGSSLRLTDFGLAVMACGPDQRLSHCCGSLPFAAPEVLRLQQKPKGQGAGYNGFAADVWSLAANFVELACGLYSMERLLGWVPQHPVDLQQRLHDIEHFRDIWATVPETGVVGLHALVKNMFALRPEERWLMGQVVGPEGFGIGEVHTCSVPGCFHTLRQRIHFAAEGIVLREVPCPLASSRGSARYSRESRG